MEQAYFIVYFLMIYAFYLQSGVLQLEDDDYIFEPVPHAPDG
jgi:hypothetical protein